jgi:hypothetical protein
LEQPVLRPKLQLRYNARLLEYYIEVAVPASYFNSQIWPEVAFNI